MRAYLDFNIIVAIRKKQTSLEKIKQVDESITDFPFSSSHIQEVDNISHPNEELRLRYINEHLETISEISKNLYLYQTLNNEVQLLNESPLEVLKTIREVPFAKSAMQSFVNLMNSDQKEEVRNMLGINSKDLNNYSPQEVVDQLNKVLRVSDINCSFLDLIESGIKHNPQGHTFGLSERFAAVYELLDLLGYWKDKQTDTSNYARLWDSNHSFFAAHCNYFISGDLRNRNKAKVVYNLYNVGTVVLNTNGQR